MFGLFGKSKQKKLMKKAIKVANRFEELLDEHDVRGYYKIVQGRGEIMRSDLFSNEPKPLSEAQEICEQWIEWHDEEYKNRLMDESDDFDYSDMVERVEKYQKLYEIISGFATKSKEEVGNMLLNENLIWDIFSAKASYYGALKTLKTLHNEE